MKDYKTRVEESTRLACPRLVTVKNQKNKKLQRDSSISFPRGATTYSGVVKTKRVNGKEEERDQQESIAWVLGFLGSWVLGFLGAGRRYLACIINEHRQLKFHSFFVLMLNTALLQRIFDFRSTN